MVEKLHNFQKEFDTFKASLEEDATELSLSVDDLISFNIHDAEATAIRDEATASILAIGQQLDGIAPLGLRQQLKASEKQIAQLHSQLDAPNRAYQLYLWELDDWKERRAMIEGDDDAPESLQGLRVAVVAFDELPAKISQLKAEQTKLALEIHAEKLSQAEVYRTHYNAVQQFIDSHELAKHKLGLEFRVELANEGFSDRLLSMLALNRRGSFMGLDEGRALADKVVEETLWEDGESVRTFLDRVDAALHKDQRVDPPTPTQVRDQLVKGKKPEDVYELVYGLGYIRPRYVLRWEGKDISMLSPGERGTLLLVFYLLIDKGEVPLVIDQPEGNLDNYTVAKVLVDSIKEARKRRQVFIVTHSPNLAVVCDADQVIYASIDKADRRNAITYVSGSLENPTMIKYVTDVLEGTRWAFRVRDGKYDVGESL